MASESAQAAALDEKAAARARVLIVDDEPLILKALAGHLRRAGMDVTTIGEPVEALGALRDSDWDVALFDITMPNLSGLELLKEVKSRRPEVEVVMMTGNASVATAIEAVRNGAYDYLTKPFESLDRVAATIQKAFERKRLLHQTQVFSRLLGPARTQFEGFVGGSEGMRQVYGLISAVGPTPATVLIQGESGTGKELVARAIHQMSPRRDKPFLAVNCSALTESLLDSELFGHVKGSFTGATANRRGLFEAANGGTLFLDEIGDVAAPTQVRLLRALQEGEIRPVGSEHSVKVDVRVVAATNVDLQKARDEGRFRSDLYYRLNVVSIELPPLRKRVDDIPLLAQHFLVRHAQRMGRTAQHFDPEALRALMRYSWPGNVRELEHLVERALVLTPPGQPIGVDALPPAITKANVSDSSGALLNLPFTTAKELTVRAFERRYLTAMLEKSGGSISAAARLAHLDRSNFRRLLRHHGLSASASATGDDGADEEALQEGKA
jgi:two-component system response regulator HydG